jgi:hypothetical protein
MSAFPWEQPQTPQTPQVAPPQVQPPTERQSGDTAEYLVQRHGTVVFIRRIKPGSCRSQQRTREQAFAFARRLAGAAKASQDPQRRCTAKRVLFTDLDMSQSDLPLERFVEQTVNLSPEKPQPDQAGTRARTLDAQGAYR